MIKSFIAIKTTNGTKSSQFIAVTIHPYCNKFFFLSQHNTDKIYIGGMPTLNAYCKQTNIESKWINMVYNIPYTPV